MSAVKMSDIQKKIVVIGLDGSSWDLVKPLVDAGRLPNIKRMMDGGMHSTMLSTNPAHSAPAWTTFATGVEPTEHGCLDFLTVNKNIDDLKLIDSTQIPQETIYEMMVRHGKTPILINLPNTFPPRLKNNTTITSLMTRGPKFVFPETLLEKYPELQKYRLNPNAKLRLQDNFDPYVKDLCVLEQDRVNAAKVLFANEPWDFFFFLSSGTDWVSHVVYDKARDEGYEPALKMWEIMDEFIGWVIDNKDSETNLLVMSDHGFTVYDRIFYVNRWLEDKGYLTTQSGKGTFHQEHTQLSKAIGKAQKKRKEFKVGKGLRTFLRRSIILEKTAKWFYFKIIKRFIPITVTVDLQLDLSKTQVAFPRGSMATMLYINDKKRFSKGTVEADEKSLLVNTLLKELRALRDTQGELVIARAEKREDIYGPKAIETAPDIFLEPERYYLSGSLHSSSLFETTKKNYHDNRGMFIAYGPDIDHRTMTTSRIQDMAPTVLHALGLPLHPQFVGSVMDVFSKNSSLHTPPVVEAVSEEHAALSKLIDDIII